MQNSGNQNEDDIFNYVFYIVCLDFNYKNKTIGILWHFYYFAICTVTVVL